MVDWQALLEGRSDGFGTPVAGARVGDNPGTIPRAIITELEPDVPLEELRKQGGRVFAEGITYEIVDGRIHKIGVHGAALSALPFKQEADIEKVLGASIGIERKRGSAIYHFPKRGLSVSWEARKDRVEYVVLGPVEWTPPTFGAKDVLKEWLAARWEPPGQSSYGMAREARLLALLRAFEVGVPEDFSHGKFLEEKSPSAYPRSTAVLRVDPHPLDDPGIMGALGRFFSWLLRYRTEDDLRMRELWGD